MRPNKICFRVYGQYALFSDPIMRMGGEKTSYPVPTYQALVGICDSVYYKPTIVWRIDRVRIMHPIQTEAKSVRPISYYKGPSSLSKYNYLAEPEYIVEAHFEWNESRPDMECDRDENKHYQIAQRSLKVGGRKDIYLGTRECQGYVEPCGFNDGDGYYDHVDRVPLGLMFHSFEYEPLGTRVRKVNFWSPTMEHGVIVFPAPYDRKKLLTRNLTGADKVEGC